MEAPPAVPTINRNGGLSMPPLSSSSSQPPRREWRAVSEQSVRNSGGEELERSKLVQSDERLIYEQRLHTVAKQREELQHMEIELRAQVIARSEVLGMQNSFDNQIKEHANANAKLQEQLHEKEQKIRELERRMDEKERELHAIRLDNEAAWAKEDLLREQSKELQSYMRERDNTESERLQHIKQIHDLQEHMQEKDRVSMELQEQHRIAQETILFKDEQLREAQAWMTRAQEMDALQSTTNHTLQAELRERTEHYNQLWLGCQRQFGEMERLHLHIQQLQLELADVREKSGSNVDGSLISQTNLKDTSELEKTNGRQLEVIVDESPSTNAGSLQGNSESASVGNTSTQADHVQVVAFGPSSLLGMPTYVPTGQVTALHPFVMHQQGVPHPSHMQPHFHSIQNWQNQQPDGHHVPSHNHYPQEPEQSLLRIDPHYDYEASGNQQTHANYAETNVNRELDADSVVPSANGEEQVLDSIDKTYDTIQYPENLHQISSQFREALSLGPLERGNVTKEKQVNPANEHSSLAVNASASEALANARSFSETIPDNARNADLTDAAAGQKNNIVGKPAESYLLDERALLASIARTIGSSGRIKISSTLSNRLGKMLAPLHWHDYRKKYGKLDDFVAGHPELFFIEGDYIQLREGAQQIIAATAAVAKVAAAAAAAPTSYSSLLPSVAVTPMSQSHRLKKAPSLETSSVDSDRVSFNEFTGPRPMNMENRPSQFPNGSSFNVAGGTTSNVKILSKANMELNGSEIRVGRSTLLPIGNATNSERSDFSQTKGASHGRPRGSSVGKQQNRAVGAASSSQRR
ncbi:hypothetical protein ABFS82_06G097600 [Erythranthe guttata]